MRSVKTRERWRKRKGNPHWRARLIINFSVVNSSPLKAGSVTLYVTSRIHPLTSEYNHDTFSTPISYKMFPDEVLLSGDNWNIDEISDLKQLP